ncbi:MAG: DUF4160 domain-containing protein [Verrucomicrobia bacterium]|nr:DUF4160 domain-containing protein [Verrucomicrobiota bacterium]
MPVIARFRGIVIRMLGARALGARIHAFFGESELVLSVQPLRIVNGDAPAEVRLLVLAWAACHQSQLLSLYNQWMNGQRPPIPLGHAA